MPIGYAVFLGSIALFTTAALLTTRRAGHTRYVLSAAINEIPHVFALALVVSTVSAWAADDLGGTSGAVLTGFAAAVVVGTGVLAHRALPAEAEVRAGLVAAGLPGVFRPGWRRLRGWLAPLPLRSPAVVRRRGLAYGPHRQQRLDVYRRRDGLTNGRVLVYLHGGGYYSGGRHREGRALLHRLAAGGWTCVSADYRLRPRAGFEEHIDDARSALRWAHAYAEEGGEPAEAVVMAGSSAGAHLAALCALTQPDDDPHLRVDGAVCLYGYYGRYYGRGPLEHPASSPVVLDPAGAPPMLIVHGDRDSWTPVEQARELRDHLRSGSSSTVAYVELTGAQHGFDLFASPRFVSVVDGVETFLAVAVPGPLAAATATGRT
ncbi:alpha/beta hydrolase [Nocardioides sp. GXQ0305]|uniref:alpha/beta hydrolase n=1 Tax=Nocardioides sp. GXQ0305 TaxID=3423912 RepID=UPI003D7E7E11